MTFFCLVKVARTCMFVIFRESVIFVFLGIWASSLILIMSFLFVPDFRHRSFPSCGSHLWACVVFVLNTAQPYRFDILTSVGMGIVKYGLVCPIRLVYCSSSTVHVRKGCHDTIFQQSNDLSEFLPPTEVDKKHNRPPSPTQGW